MDINRFEAKILELKERMKENRDSSELYGDTEYKNRFITIAIYEIEKIISGNKIDDIIERLTINSFVEEDGSAYTQIADEIISVLEGKEKESALYVVAKTQEYYNSLEG